MRSLVKPSPALVLAFVALLVALGGNSGAFGGASTAATSAPKPNVVGVKAQSTITNGETAHIEAKCPHGYEIFAGGYAGGGQHTIINAAAPARGIHGYLLDAVEPPVNFNAAVLRETATIRVVGFCVPFRKPIVFPTS
jgi:hypothetical protein